MRFVRQVFALLLCFQIVANAEGNTFTKVRYNGGSISTKVKPDDWDNKLTVASEAITLSLKDGQSVSIPPKQVTSLSYGQEAHRRVGTAIGLAVVSLGIGALSALHKTKLHYIGIDYADVEGKKQGVLLQGDKSNFRAILVALQGVTGAPVSVGEKDRSEIAVGITTRVTSDPDSETDKSDASAQAAKAPALVPVSATTQSSSSTGTAEAAATIALVSNPEGADIYVDNAFSGNAPSTLKLKPGKHTIRTSMAGFKDWSREITLEASSEVHLTATMEK